MSKRYSLLVYGAIGLLAAGGLLEGARAYGIRLIAFQMNERGYEISMNVIRGGKETVYSASTYETEGYGYIIVNQWDQDTGDNFKNLWAVDLTP